MTNQSDRIAEQERIELLMDLEGCTCHIHPPCTWCTTINEEEFDIYATEGARALSIHLMTKLDQLYGLYEI